MPDPDKPLREQIMDALGLGERQRTRRENDALEALQQAEIDKRSADEVRRQRQKNADLESRQMAEQQLREAREILAQVKQTYENMREDRLSAARSAENKISDIEQRIAESKSLLRGKGR